MGTESRGAYAPRFPSLAFILQVAIFQPLTNSQHLNSIIHSVLLFQSSMSYTAETIIALCNVNLRAVERSIVILFGSGIVLDRKSSQWWESKGKYYAKWVMSGKHLTGMHLVNARKVCAWHSEQLARLANSIVAAKAAQVETVIEAEIVE